VPGLSASDSAAITAATLTDACAWLDSRLVRAVPPREPCVSVGNGVLTNGIQAGIHWALSLQRQLRDRRYAAVVPVNSVDGTGLLPTASGSAASSLYSIPQELAGSSWRAAVSVVDDHILPALDLVTEQYLAAAYLTIEKYRSFLVAFVSAFLVLFCSGILLIFLPTVGRLGKDIHSKRAMLLLLPIQVSWTHKSAVLHPPHPSLPLSFFSQLTVKVPSIRALVFQIVAESEGLVASGSVGMRSEASPTSAGRTGPVTNGV